MEIDHAGRVAELIAERVKDLQLAAERRAIEVQLGEHTIFVNRQSLTHRLGVGCSSLHWSKRSIGKCSWVC
jgi:hypothetical protein